MRINSTPQFNRQRVFKWYTSHRWVKELHSLKKTPKRVVKPKDFYVLVKHHHVQEPHRKRATPIRAGLNYLEALSVNNSWARLIIFVFGDPHILERRQGREDGSTNPDRVLSLRRSYDLDLRVGWSKSSDLLLQT